jgi:ABC-type glutathione transport system ATPase component
MAGELLQVSGVTKVYPRSTVALRGVSLTLSYGATLGLVGPSGCGKSTLARCIARWEVASSGDIAFDGGRQRIQLICQQPAASLNPRFTAAEIVEEPLVIRKVAKGDAAARALELVGLPANILGRRAYEFSGGERQRLAIARALVSEPKLLILDESFAGLDPGLQNQLAALLRGLQARLGLAYLLISHDLELVADLADEIAVMDAGEIVERGAAQQLMANARHPVTQRLIAAARALSLEGPAA